MDSFLVVGTRKSSVIIKLQARWRAKRDRRYFFQKKSAVVVIQRNFRRRRLLHHHLRTKQHSIFLLRPDTKFQKVWRMCFLAMVLIEIIEVLLRGKGHAARLSHTELLEVTFHSECVPPTVPKKGFLGLGRGGSAKVPEWCRADTAFRTWELRISAFLGLYATLLQGLDPFVQVC